jgi:hypothetical protein
LSRALDKCGAADAKPGPNFTPSPRIIFSAPPMTARRTRPALKHWDSQDQDVKKTKIMKTLNVLATTVFLPNTALFPLSTLQRTNQIRLFHVAIGNIDWRQLFPVGTCSEHSIICLIECACIFRSKPYAALFGSNKKGNT